ncbi:FecR domain-containing protein [Methylocapsa sp. S129]|uniref:FecR family protein n=1 Tax=Methylocapsa sp. S129 TaxID=1641869 RepID=UPI00131D3B93|nr:FecR domain-containing protein [Methylocapsa sp. S129]
MDETDRPDAVSDRAVKDARDWVVRLSSGSVTEAELARFKAWRYESREHAQAFARERSFWQQLQPPGGRSDALEGEASSQGTAQRTIGRRAVLVGGGAVAASVVAYVAAPCLKLLLEADYRTAAGEQKRVALPDGSIATLNTDSAIALRYQPNLRLVQLLEGEVLFEVKSDARASFRVAAFGGNTDATGTAFAVRALDDQATITVTEGQVRVFGPADPMSPTPHGPPSAVTVNSNQQTRYVEGGSPGSATTVDAETILAWRSGRVIFEGRPFANALAELGRYVPERIILGNQSQAMEPISAIFSIRQAYAAIEALASTQSLTVRRIPGVMILVS